MKTQKSELSFLFHRDVQRIFNNFTALFQIRIGFYSPDGKELKVGLDQGLCEYCRMIRRCKSGAAACLNDDQTGRFKAMNNRNLLVYDCHGGMTEAVKPVYRDEVLLGFVMIGQIRTRETPPAKWQKAWKESGCAGSLDDIFRKTPFCGKADLSRILELFSDLMNLITDRHLIESRNADRLTNLVAGIRNSPGKYWSLSAAAETLHISESRLSHLFTGRFGKPFTSLLREIRIESARVDMIQNPGKSIKAIAVDAGFSDSGYFSRVFRQETGKTPREYRNQQENPHF